MKELQREIVGKIYIQLDENIREVYLDITYDPRFIPFIALGLLLPARYVSIKKIYIYYGYWESPTDVKPAIELTSLEEMIELDEAMATFQFIGNFHNPAAIIYRKAQDKFRQALCLPGVNDADTELLNELSKYPENYFYLPISSELKKLSRSAELEEVFIEKAKFYFPKAQYFKVIRLLFETILTLVTGKLYGEEVKSKYLNKEKTREKIYNT